MLISYSLSCSNRASKYLEIKCLFPVNSETTILQLAVFRPGKYAIQNFSQKIKDLEFLTSENICLEYKVLDENSWQINTENLETIVVSYKYYSDVLDAGNGCFIDEKQIYINPATCLIYPLGQEHSQCQLLIECNKDHTSCGADFLDADENRRLLITKDLHQLFDTPFVLAKKIERLKFEVSKTQIIINFINSNYLPKEKIEYCFKKFIVKQIELFESPATSKFEFLIQLTSDTLFHGVEHSRSTVIAIGPKQKIFQPQEKFLSDEGVIFLSDEEKDFYIVASHEFFHTWNVKRFKPKEYIPYDYSILQLSSLHWLTEGATCYFEDKRLYESGVFSKNDYYLALEKYLNTYLEKLFLSGQSVAESSLYSNNLYSKNNSPFSRNNFYVSGKLVAWLLDLTIQNLTDSTKNLTDLFKYLDKNFSQEGYTEEDIKDYLESICGQSLDTFFSKYIWGKENLIEALKPMFKNRGISLINLENSDLLASWFGIKLNMSRVITVHPSSQAYHQLSIDDQIIAIEEELLTNLQATNLMIRKKLSKEKELSFSVNRNNQLINIKLVKESGFFDQIKLNY